MIPRYQKIVVLVLLVVSVGMAAVLVRLRERAHDRLLKGEDVAPTVAPEVAPEVQATLMVANDADDALVAETQSLPLPVDAEARARAVLEKLLELYAGAGSMHPVPGVPRAVLQVFLLAQRQSKSDAALRRGATGGGRSGWCVCGWPSLGDFDGDADGRVDLRDAACEFAAGSRGAVSGEWEGAGDAGWACGFDADVFDGRGGDGECGSCWAGNGG